MTEAAPVVIGSKAEVAVTCSNCGKQGMTSEFFTYQGAKGTDLYLCPGCREKTNETLAEAEKKVNVFSGFALGLVATIAGAVVWYYISILSGVEYGYVSLGLGYLVGYAVYFGAGKHGAKKLQVISALLVVLGIFIAEYSIFSHTLHTIMAEDPSKYVGWDGQPVWIDPWSPLFLEGFMSPIGLLIYAIGIYFGYKICKPIKV